MSGTQASRDEGVDERQTAEPASPVSWPVVELRQYTLKPGRRDELIALFEQHFIEGQEQCGMQVLGQFRRRTAPDQFVWLRGFADMDTRRQALQAFYGGPIWHAHRTVANATMIDSDNVLLLKPVRATSGVQVNPSHRPALEAHEAASGIVIVTVSAFSAPVDGSFVASFETHIVPVLRAVGGALLGYYVTEPTANTFPQLPVREGEHVFVWIASFADEDAYAGYQIALTAAPDLKGWLSGPAEVLELAPTRRSLMRHPSTPDGAVIATAPRGRAVQGACPR